MDILSVNKQIADSIAQVNTQLLGSSPAMSMGNLYMATSQALSLAALNAAQAQQQNNILAQAATVMGITTIYSIGTATLGVSAADLLRLLAAK